MATENKYKKGDWVRAKGAEVAAHWNAYWAEQSGVTATADTVFKVYDGDMPDESITIGAGDAEKGPTWYASRFEPWRPKVGERVRYIGADDSRFYTNGKDYEALSFDGSVFAFSDNDNDGPHFWPKHEVARNFEPITDTLPVAEQPAALTIQAGKFYKTRDGRKVGPMAARSWGGFFDDSRSVTSQHWSASGTFIEGCISNLDLIAEWVDTPVRDITAATVDAINDEYGPVVREVPVAAQPSRFKVGDRVQSLLTGSILTITAVERAPRSGKVVYSAEGDNLARGRFVDEHIRLAPTPAIVCKIDNGQPLPATRPAVHATVESADAEARRLAGIHKGQEFGVFVLTGATHKEAKVYEHEWQRLAAEGRCPLAVSSLVRSAGIQQEQARRIVYDFAA